MKKMGLLGGLLAVVFGSSVYYLFPNQVDEVAEQVGDFAKEKKTDLIKWLAQEQLAQQQAMISQYQAHIDRLNRILAQNEIDYQQLMAEKAAMQETLHRLQQQQDKAQDAMNQLFNPPLAQ